MKVFENPEKANWADLLKRPTSSVVDIENSVLQVFDEVERLGDQAIKKYTSLFDNVELDNFRVTTQEVAAAKSNIKPELKEAIQLAKNNIEKFHKSQFIDKNIVETTKGVTCWNEQRPIEKVGLYIPGGTAPLFSTVLMLAIPAVLAGCKEIILCSPPNRDGKLNDAILYAADLCGVSQVFKIGGIQAIAAMTFGTQSVPMMYKIFGPGNQFVTTAKQLATKYGVAIDMPAGPSELMVVCDTGSNAAFVASDLLSQAEHGVDSQVVLVSTSKTLIEQVQNEIELQIAGLPRRDIAKRAMKNSKCILVDTDDQAIAIINAYGPEHLIICAKNEAYFVDNIINAGSVFLGNYTPESAGDYASGTNHTLPTNGYAKQYSGVNLASFMKSITFQKITEIGLQNIGPSVELMAAAEGLQAHKNAVSIRLKYLSND